MRVIDLFSGVGGFALGAKTAGMDVVLSVDVDPVLSSSHRLNFPNGQLLLADVRTLTGKQLRSLVKADVDVVLGGPPCQGFSTIGRGRIDDPRRELVGEFFRLVREIAPAFFLMENVVGLVSPKNRPSFNSCLDTVGAEYNILGPVILDAVDFGAATKRKRIFVLGSRKDCRVSGSIFESQVTDRATVRDAIGDLSTLLSSEDDCGFDVWNYGEANHELSNYAVRLRDGANFTTSHRKTPHKAEIVSRFDALRPGATDSIGRHPRLSWDGHCPTLRAGTGPDRGSYQAVRPIHPSDSRVITVREAARLQGFPDWFRFHPTVWHSFRMIGNSVSPILAQAVLAQLALSCR